MTEAPDADSQAGEPSRPGNGRNPCSTRGSARHSRVARLLKPAEFELVFKHSERARTDSLLVMAKPNQLTHARLGMVVAKRLLPRAVDRNRVKRCVRETFRLQRSSLPACDFVVRLIAKPVAGEEAGDLARTLVRAGQRAMKKWPTSIITSTEQNSTHG